MAADSPSAQRAWKTLDEGLHASRVDHREQSLVAMSTLPGTNQAAVQKVVAVMQHDQSVRVRAAAATALGKMKATSASPALEAELKDQPEVAFAAAKALSEMGNPAGERYLERVLKGEEKPEPGMMTNAMRSTKHDLAHPKNLLLTGAAGATGAVFPPAGVGVAALRQAGDMRSNGGGGRAEAAASLAKHKDPAVVKDLEGALDDNNHAVRIEAARGLGEEGDPASIDKLLPLLKDQHTGVRSMAAASIVRLSQ